ncbi:MAG TPA: hypothetical protein VHH33_08090 [Nitrososphaeraceae archaeon]|jgi:hypothetical protein|nr:hypothetical protein [Nitrososphaeraceae archaeon]
MTDILKKRVTDIGNLVSGNGTDTGLPPVTISSSDAAWALVGKVATCTLIGGRYLDLEQVLVLHMRVVP